MVDLGRVCFTVTSVMSAYGRTDGSLSMMRVHTRSASRGRFQSRRATATGIGGSTTVAGSNRRW
ncbi:hypothetical protein BHE97_04955 [Aeromicrobium sp. PE09-221]|nr:hypothetical protein BHE97_04955 [Aeromicrobium sp. PE09-221]